MVKKLFLYLFGSLFVVSLFLSFGPAKANNPSSMTLEYSENTELLNVTISHSSVDFNTHYIFEVIVTMDGFQIYNQSYTSQPSNVFTYSYYIDATPLELLSYIIEVTARCTQTGIITRSITIGQLAHIPETIPGFAGLWFIISASMMALIVINNKKLRK